MVMVKNFHSFAQDTVFADFNFAQARDGGSGNIGAFPEREFPSFFYGNKVGLIDFCIFGKMELCFRVEVEVVVFSPAKCRMDGAFFVSEKLRALVAADAPFFIIIEKGQDFSYNSFHNLLFLSRKQI